MPRWKILITLLTAGSLSFATELALEKRVVEHTCPNGIKLLVLERHFSPTVSIRMIFRTGRPEDFSKDRRRSSVLAF